MNADALPLCGAAAGLVSVSTTRKGIEDILLIDREQARFTRLQKNVGIGAKLHMLDLAGKRVNACMVTLTYRGVDDWQCTHLTTYMDHVRNWYRSLTGEKLRYVWVAETQQRGAIHYHCIFWLAKGVTMPKADKRGWWPHGMSNTLKATSPVSYLVSYAKKLQSKKGLPHGARIYGVGGLPPASRCIRRWVNWPAFVQARAAVTDSYGPKAGGGWVNRVTGQWWPSEFGLVLTTPRTTAVVRLHDHGRPVADVVGPYSWRSEDVCLH